MRIYDFNNESDFAELEKQAYAGTIQKIENFPPVQYKYFSELTKLYGDFKAGVFDKEYASDLKKKLFKEYKDNLQLWKDYCTVYKCYQDNIRISGTLLSDIEKSKDVYNIAHMACELIGMLTGDTEFHKRQMGKLIVKNEATHT